MFTQDVKTGICISQEFFKIKYSRQGLYFILRIIFLLIVKKKIERGNNSKFINKHYFLWTSYKKKNNWILNGLILTYSKISTVDKALAPLRPFSQDTVPGAEDFTFLFCLSNNEKNHHILLWTIEHNTCILKTIQICGG